MNERIKELWTQAGGNFNQGNQHTWPQYTIDNPEKFAELIVRECALLVQGVPVDTTGYHTADQKIKEHFEVEK